jgi:hypothetical protein
MRMNLATALVAAFLVAVSAVPRTAAAQQVPVLSAPSAFAPTAPLRPFGNLFGRVRPVKPLATTLFTPPARGAAGKDLVAQPSRTIVCGMKLVPADPAFDAAIRHAVPENSPAFTMRTAPPPVCRQ